MRSEEITKSDSKSFRYDDFPEHGGPTKTVIRLVISLGDIDIVARLIGFSGGLL